MKRAMVSDLAPFVITYTWSMPLVPVLSKIFRIPVGFTLVFSLATSCSFLTTGWSAGF
jgi:hypothetical protein